MNLKVLDSSEHADLWEQIDDSFEYIPTDFYDHSERETLIDQFLQEELCSTDMTTPLLLVFHISEYRYSNGEPFRISREMYESWPLKDQIYVLFVTGGSQEAANKLISDENLPESHFRAYSLAEVEDTWSVPQRKAWQGFLNVLSLTGQASWFLLTQDLEPEEEHKRKFGQLILNDTFKAESDEWRQEKAWLLSRLNENQGKQLNLLINEFEQSSTEASKHKLYDFIFGNDDGLPGVQLG